MRQRVGITLVIAVVVLAWIIGRIHIGLIDLKSVGGLRENDLSQRMIFATTLIAPLLVVLGGTGKAALREYPFLFTPSLLTTCVSFYLMGLIGYMEAYWYGPGRWLEGSFRRSFFEEICLPLVFGATWFFWIFVSITWLVYLLNRFSPPPAQESD